MGQMDNKRTSVGFIDLLTLVFIILKLTGTIDWSWWLVLSPVWSILSVMGILSIIIVMMGDDL